MFIHSFSQVHIITCLRFNSYPWIYSFQTRWKIAFFTKLKKNLERSICLSIVYLSDKDNRTFKIRTFIFALDREYVEFYIETPIRLNKCFSTLHSITSSIISVCVNGVRDRMSSSLAATSHLVLRNATVATKRWPTCGPQQQLEWPACLLNPSYLKSGSELF